MAAEKPMKVTRGDVAEVLAGLRPGTTHTSIDLYRRYESEMAGQSRPVASRASWGRALSLAGCERKLVRKRHGPRGAQVATETHCWVLPGERPVPPNDERMCEVLRSLGEGTCSNDRIWRTYETLARKRGWFAVMSRPQVSEWLNRKGFAKFTEHGQPCRYIDISNVDWIMKQAR